MSCILPVLDKPAHYCLRHRHRSSLKRTRTLGHHKPHNASTVNTGRASTGAFRDRRCKKETHSPLLTKLTLKFQLVSLQVVRHRAEVVVT
jgi:hypothetical protein